MAMTRRYPKMVNPDESARIEADLGETRRALGAALADFKASLTLRGLAAQAVTTARAHPGPTALAVGGLGLAACRGLASQEDPQRTADWMAAADALRARAVRMLAEIDKKGGDPDERMQRRSNVLDALASDVRRILSQDLQDLPQAERARALATREAAYAAHLGARGCGEPPDDGASRPLWFGAALAAAGAAAALLLPRSRIEEQLLGDVRRQILAAACQAASDDLNSVGLLARTVVALVSERPRP